MGADQVLAAFAEVAAELEQARTNHVPLNSAHEGYAVILEEVEELKSEVFWGRKTRSDEKWVQEMKKEAVQVAAMALRFLLDIPPRYVKETEG